MDARVRPGQDSEKSDGALQHRHSIEFVIDAEADNAAVDRRNGAAACYLSRCFFWGAQRIMLIPKRYDYFVFGFIQSGFTCAVAAGIASAPFLGQGMFISQWLKSWLIAWIVMTPFVLLAAPLINRAVAAL